MHKVVELVKQWETFDQQQPEGSLADFCSWYLQAQPLSPLPLVPPSFDLPTDMAEKLQVGILIGRIELLLQFYARKIMQDLPIKNFEEFRYMGMLVFMGEVRKSELIYHSLLDFSTGTHLINRLIKNGWVEEIADPTDGRAKIVKLSAEGRKMQEKLRPKIFEIFNLLFAQTTTEQRQVIIETLQQIDQLHTKLLVGSRQHGVDELLDKIKEEKEKQA